MKQNLVLLLAFLFPSFLLAQQSGTGIKGCVIGAESNRPVPGVIVTLNGEGRQTRCKRSFLFRQSISGKGCTCF